MGESNIRNYQVNYAINANGNASEYFMAMAENVTKMQEPLNALQNKINQINRVVTYLSRNESLKNLFNIKPTMDLSGLKASLSEAEKMVNTSAERMASKLNAALSSAASLKTSTTKTSNAPVLSEKAIRDQIAKLEKQFLLESGGKALSKVKGRDDTTPAAWATREELKKWQKKLKSISGSKMSKTAESILGPVKKAEEIDKAATAITNLNKAVSGFNNRKAIKVKIDADVTKAISKYNAFLKQVQETVVTAPLAIEAAATKAKKGKGKGAKSGGVVPATPENVANLIKGKEKAVAIKSSFNGGDAAFQLNQSIAKLQKLADTKHIVIRGMFNGGDAAFQLNQSIVRLQELANTKPIMLKATTSATPSAPNNGTAPTSPTTSTKNGKGTTQTNSNKWAATQSQINAYERHRGQMADMRINSAVDLAKQRAKAATANRIANQAMYDQLFGREAMHQQWLARDAAGETTRAKRNAAREAISNRAAINAMRHNANELQRLHTVTAPPVIANEPMASSKSGYYSTYRNNGGYSSTPARGDLYTRSRAFWYPFTGNTSFGARTPMAVDMAKGMGTMFAIGGAMSAVGSSLSQAVEYQNIMKTTNAILKNGTSTYTDSGFTGMEQIVRQVGKDTKFTAPQVASAAKFLAMAGYDIPAINEAIKPVSNIALIGDTDLGETADKLTNVMTTFGINPSQMNDIADIMTTTFTRSNTDMMMLAESAKYAGGIAHLYGGSFKNNFADVMAMFGVLGNAGIQASSAGTTLRMMYQNLMQPNKNQRATLKKYGIFTRDTSGKPLEMVDILKQIRAKVPEEQLADAVGSMFRITAQPGAAALVTSLKKDNGGLVDLMTANRNAAGSGITENIANEKKDTVAGLWAQVQSTFTEGVLQAFEGREGGWAGMLGQLRDYLAQPETVETLKSIIDLVENLARIMGNFAKIYAKVYTAAPGLVNFWIKAQLAFTQLGYLVTPVIQLIGVLTMLKTALIGTSAAAATATAVENTAKNAQKTNAVATVLGAATPLTTAKRAANGGLVAANIAAATLPYQYFKPYYEFAGRKARPDILGPLSLYRNRNVVTLAEKATFDKATQEKIALYERSRMYGWGSMTKTQKKQLNGTINRKIAELRGARPTGHIEHFILPPTFGIGSEVYRHGRQYATSNYYRAGIDKVMPLNQYSGRAAAVLQGGKMNLDNAAKYRLYAQRWGDISTYKNISTEQRAMAAQKSEKYLEAAILASQLEQKQKMDAIAAESKRVADSRNAIMGASAARHASRGVIASEVRDRYAQRYGFKAGAKMTWGTSFNAGKALGTLSLASMMTSIKSMALSLFSGLAKAIGMLVSPIGLVTVAIGTAVAATLWQIKRIKDKEKESDKKAQDNAIKANKARQTAYAPIEKWEKENITIGNALPSIEDTTPKPNLVSDTKTLQEKYKDAFDTSGANDKAQKNWVNQIISRRNSRLAFGGRNLSYQPGRNISGKKTLNESINYYVKDEIAGTDAYFDQLRNAKNSNGANARAWEALFLEGATNERTSAAQQQIAELRKQLIAKKITQNEFIKKANEIRSSVANPNAKGLLNATDYTATEIGKNQHWDRFQQFQQGSWNVLTAELNAEIGTVSGYLQGVDQLKSGVKQYSDQWWQAVARVYDGMQYSLKTPQGTINAILRALPNGRIDTSSIIQQLQQVANTLQLNISDFANMAASVYEILAKSGLVPGKYYSDFRKFTWAQTQHSNVTKTDAGLYFDQYIAKGDKNAKWGGMSKEEYIDFVTDTSNKGRAAQERVLIRRKFSNKAADNAKRQHDKTMGAINGLTGGKGNGNGTGTGTGTDNGSTNGTVGGTDKDKTKNQKDYANTYDRSAARPTQVIINIDSLARFDRTAIAKNADDRAIAEAMETKIAEAIAMLSSQALNAAGSVVAQNV